MYWSCLELSIQFDPNVWNDRKEEMHLQNATVKHVKNQWLTVVGIRRMDKATL